MTIIGIVIIITIINTQKPAFFCADGKFRWFLLANVPKLQELYWPPIWAIQTHVQTALANYLRGRLPELPYYRFVSFILYSI